MARTEIKPSTPGSMSARDAARLEETEPRHRIRGRNFTKADVLVYRLEGREVAVKDYAPRGPVVRNTLGRFLVRREARAYGAADGLTGLPRFLGRLGPFALALEYVEARPLAELRDHPFDDAFFDRLGDLVAGLHSRGVALGDLHHRDVLVAADDSIFIVDLATAWVASERAGRLRRALFRRLADLDLIAVARMRARWTGHDPEAEAAKVGTSSAAWHARGRRLKRIWNRLRRRGRSRSKP